MATSRRALVRTLVAVAVTLVGAATIAIGTFAGAGLWVVALIGGGILGGIATLTAISVVAASAGALAPAHEASIDPVTGLANPDRLRTDLDRVLNDSAEHSRMTLYVCTLDGLKSYNDAYGDAVGDALLAWLGRKLRSAVDDRATAYRLRGASFAVLAASPESASPESAEPESAAAELRSAVATALLEVGEGFTIACTIGDAVLGIEAATADEAIELAARRAQAGRHGARAESKLRPPEEPIDAIRMVAPRYDVAALAVRIGRRLGVPAGELGELEAAAHLRDVGNIAIPSAVLTRAGAIPGHEWEFIRLHTTVGERLLATNFAMERVAKLVRSSHERWDGSGYPDGLARDASPLAARIVFVCSAFQDMTSDRPHRQALEAAAALTELARGAGTQFDPEIVCAFQEEFEVSQDLRDGRLDHQPRRRLAVLVADDDPASRFLLQRAIETAGHDCVAVDDGSSAWEAFERERPDIVISDWRLPEYSGEELCRRIRAALDAPQPYFVMLTPLRGDEPVQRESVAGVDELLTKPFDRQDLEALLETATSREPAPDGYSAGQVHAVRNGGGLGPASHA